MEYFMCFSCFITFEDASFFFLLNTNIIWSYVTRVTEKEFLFFFFFCITLLFRISLLPIISLRFLLLLYIIIGLSWNIFFNVGLRCNKCRCLSMIFLKFGKFLLNFSTSGILGLFAIFGFDVKKASFFMSDIQLNCSVRKFY